MLMLVTAPVSQPDTSSEVREVQYWNILLFDPLSVSPLISILIRLYWYWQVNPVPDGSFPITSMIP